MQGVRVCEPYARVFLAGRTLAKLERVAQVIADAGGTAETAEVDALDERVVNEHADAVAKRAGGIDIALNAVGIVHVQGPPFAELSLEDFAHPIAGYTRTNFLTARAVARPHVRARLRRHPDALDPWVAPDRSGFLGYGTPCAAVEAFSRILAGELGPSGIRVLCLRPDAIPEALDTSHVRAVFEGFASRANTTVEAMVAERARAGTLLGRFPTLAKIADTAAFVASDRASAITGAIVNVTCGSLVD